MKSKVTSVMWKHLWIVIVLEFWNQTLVQCKHDDDGYGGGGGDDVAWGAVITTPPSDPSSPHLHCTSVRSQMSTLYHNPRLFSHYENHLSFHPQSFLIFS